jgi:hypothetical protein
MAGMIEGRCVRFGKGNSENATERLGDEAGITWPVSFGVTGLRASQPRRYLRGVTEIAEIAVTVHLIPRQRRDTYCGGCEPR